MFTLLMNTITNLSLSVLDWNYNYVSSYDLRIGKSKKNRGWRRKKKRWMVAGAPLDRWPGLRSLLARAHSMEELP